MNAFRDTKNFKIDEFNCNCGCGMKAQQEIIDACQHLRDTINAPIIVNRGVSCPKHNEAVGGADHSMHLMGIAADIKCPSIQLVDLFKAALQIFKPGAIGTYRYGNSAFLHVDLRDRREGLYWFCRTEGKYEYMDANSVIKELEETIT